MFRKTNRTKNIRRKIETSDNEQEGNQPTVVTKTPLKAKSEKKKKAVKNVGLSFDQQEDDQEDVFKVKKSKASQRMTSQGKLQVPETSTVDTDVPKYNDDYLASLRANTPTLPATFTSHADDSTDDLLAEKFPKTMTARLGDTSIPDANAIHAAKKQRERKRQGIQVMDHDQGFISLDDDKKVRKKNYGRLIREEDDVADDGEVELEQYMGDKMILDKSKAKQLESARKQNVRELIEDAQSDADSDDSEQMERWEKDLIKHGGVRMNNKDEQIDPYKVPKDYSPAPIPEPSQLPTVDSVLMRLDMISSDMTSTLQQYEKQLSDVQKRMEDTQVSHQDLEKELQQNSKRYDYFHSLSDSVNNLSAFFDEKMPLLEDLEKEAYDVLSTQKEIATRRRWLDDMDALMSFCQIADRYLEQDALELEEHDEFGRERESLFSATTQTRRTTERQQRMDHHREAIAVDEDTDMAMELGLWSDDEVSDTWHDKKESKLETLQLDKVEDILEDVNDDFSSLAAVIEHFEAWRTKFPDDYTKAFGSLSLPAAFEFHVRCELVSWDPFSTSVELDGMNWHAVLSSFGVIDDENDQVDVELINKVVEKVVMKRVKHLLGTMNPVSGRQMRYGAHLFEQLSYYVEKQDRAFQDLLAAVEKVIEEPLLRYAQLVDAIVDRPSCLTEEQQANKHFFIARQMKYLKNLQHWRRYLSPVVLQSLGKMVVHRLIAPLLQPSLHPPDNQLQQDALALFEKLTK
ncbi:GCFC-domain-containing protein [Hesseltinella vesiculosa]|uniref:GCFC-domain-containing protein n=1 Tax=Hesseltinella vesiculosa TaxID=101127 RepID=A0A1X2GH85_9FUNG|nr:GCFC-domain-containing protein [Hesseltinella vesiculosa]